MYDFIRGLLYLVAADSKTNLAASLIESENLSYFYRIGRFGGLRTKTMWASTKDVPLSNL